MSRRLCVLFLCSGLVGCGSDAAWQVPEPDGERVATLTQKIRPTDGTGWNNNGFGVAADVYDPPGGHFRVFYVTSTDNAVDPTDVLPKNGVPDFVEAVGAAAEATYQSTVLARGFRQMLDDSVYHDRPDFGGDGRFDIYLRWAGKGSDGYRVTEACTDGSDGKSPGRCAGYFVMNPSYKGTSYPTELDGIRVLTSHELFHSIQDAYGTGQWRTVSEGTAVWNELQVFPDSVGTWKDYLGFLPAFFREPDRPLDKSMGSGPAAAYAYGTAVFFEFLSERFAPKLIRTLWEGLLLSPTGEAPLFLDVLDEVFRRDYGTNLEAAFSEFTRWNLLTSERASVGTGYLRAKEYPSVRFEPDLVALPAQTSVEVNGLSARYLRLRPALAAPQTVRVTVNDPATMNPTVALAVQKASGEVGTLVDGGSAKDVRLAEGESLLVVLTGSLRGARARTVDVQFAAAPTPPIDKMPDTDPPMASGCAVSGRSSSWSPGPIGLLLCALAFVRRRLLPWARR